MRSRFLSQIILAPLVVISSVVEAQAGATVWSGSIESREGVHDVRYRIPHTLGRRVFDILDANDTIRATNIEFSGISLRFRATIRGDATCKLDAIPARGYRGTCALATGDTIRLTLVPPTPGMLLPDHEVALARDAGPPRIARDAAVLALGPAGYAEMVTGTNGFTCFIERPSANDLWPMCHNREAARSLVPVERFRARLRIAGVGDAAITDSVLGAYRGGRFHAPPSGALAYMLSRYAWTADPESGAQSFISPHLHIYAPGTTNARIGVDTTLRPVVAMRVEREGRPDASIIVVVKLIEPATSRP